MKLCSKIIKPDHEPFKMANGMHMYEYQAKQKNAREAELFNQGMLNYSKWSMTAILEKYDEGFKDVMRVLVDVGGGLGCTLCAITERYPHIHGINFDLPHVIASCVPHQGVYLFKSSIMSLY
jgi:caffeic acid 3-O-methyltransferase